MDHQKYTHVIHPASPVFIGLADDLAPANINEHWRTSADTNWENRCDEDHICATCPDSPDTAVPRFQRP
jgi:hypothetical protein